MRYRILLAGFGNVGREFARLLLDRHSELARVHGLEPLVVGIFTARHGSVQRSGGIDLRKALRRSGGGLSLESCGRPIRGSSVDIIQKTRADVVVEVTPLRITPRQIALDHIVAALSSGKHVITANKGPVVYHYRKLRDLARHRGVGFRYEGTVMDGAPVFNLFQETLRGIRILAFEGILNSTTNLILSMIEEGRTYHEGVDAARRMGLLETDPAMDLQGWDATVKACLLANVLMDGRLRPERVPREGITSLTRDRIDRARASQRRLKLIARGWRDGSAVKASVSLKSLGPKHPLFPVRGTSSSLVVRTDMLRELQIIERDPGVRQTAYALYSDLLAIHEGRLSP
jgi:homoserine dehydrogenase